MPPDQNKSYEELLHEIQELRGKYATATQYIRRKVNQLLTVMGTAQLKPEELDDKTLIELDPIGIVSDSFVQVLRHLKETNEQVMEAHDEIKAIFDSAGMGILVLDQDMRVLAYNKKCEEQFRIDRDGALGKYCRQLLCNDPPADCPGKLALETGRAFQRDVILEGRHFDVVATPLQDRSGAVTRIIMVYMDLTERMLAQETLRRSEERYRDIFENSMDLIQVLGPDGTIRYVNGAWRQTLGYDDHELESLSIFDIIHPDCSDCEPELKSIVCGYREGTFQTSFRTKTGARIAVEGNVSSITEEGKFSGTRGIFRDITERKRAEAQLAAEREQLAVTLRSIGDGVITTDVKGSVVLINKVAERLTGWKQADAFGKSITDVFHIEDEKTGAERFCPVERVLESRLVCELEGNAVLIARDGARRLITDSVAPILDKNSALVGTVLVFRDVTERKKLEERINKSEKIEALGVLAGGIAHDFNNLLNAIVGNIDIGRKFSSPDGEVFKSMVRAEKASAKAKELTQQLLTFAKGGAPVKKLAAISDLIRDTADFGTRGSSVRCEFLLPEDLWNAEIDEGQISQVINNLVINAVQAMPQGGTIRISACNTLVVADQLPDLKQGNYVKIVVQDRGQGIPREHIDRIFDPYFTTKDTGSGLGLATTYSIIKKHDGAMEVESSPGTGTTFTLYLPASREVTATSRVQEAPTPPPGWSKVLFMDDDAIVVETGCILLNLLGYQAEVASNGDEALKKYGAARDSGSPYDLVIMDLTIKGGKGGRETITKLLELDPDAKVIVSSGYSHDAVMSNYKEYGFSGLIIKPYTVDELGEEMQRVLKEQGKKP